MFIRTLKVFKKQSKTGSNSQNHVCNISKKSPKKHTLQTIQNSDQINKKSQLNLNNENSRLSIGSPQKQAKQILINFQNQYIKAQSKKQSILDSRKKFIKQKIKVKVKQQIADLIKREQLLHRSLTDMKLKSEFIKQSALDVSVKGSSLKKSLRNSFTHRPQFVKLQKIRKSNNQNFLMKQSVSSQKICTVESSPRQKIKGRRSLSNIIRLHHITSQKGVRHIHSALDEMKILGKKDSVQIQPWQYVEDN